MADTAPPPVAESSIRSPWGKTDKRTVHHLAHHCADVAACFEAISILPSVRGRMEKAANRALSSIDVSRLAVLAFLHDCGKLHPGFQAKGWPEGNWKSFLHGHVPEGTAIFRGAMEWQIACNLHLDKLQAWGVDENLLYAVIAHHGRPFQMTEAAIRRWQEVPMLYSPVMASADIGALLPYWFQPAFEENSNTLPNTPDFQHLLCGLVTLSDWLGSTQKIFPYVSNLDPDYMDIARRKAQLAVRDIGLDVSTLRKALIGQADFATLSGGKSPWKMQELIGRYSLNESLVILEAETGSGKTEAALWRFVKAFEAGKVDSLYFALPTRAAAKQIHSRVNDTMKRIFGTEAPEAVLAVPGYIKAGEEKGIALPGWQVRWDDDDGIDERKRLARWSAENTKRYLAATIAVGTIDQVMLAGLQVKHAHLRSAALSRALLVIDEIHASDRYMSEVQAHMLKTHLSRGGHAMLMSATLGSVARVKWLNQRQCIKEQSFAKAAAAPYPAVWGMKTPMPFGVETTGREKQVSMTLATPWSAEEAVNHAIDAAHAGAKVLVIRNTVKRALETFEAIHVAGEGQLLWQVASGPALHHARFAPEDRELLDREVEKALSPVKTTRLRGGEIVIGTQTLEQSLDICADFLITDLCPSDVLLQRIGRLHRHDLPRPKGFKTPACVVLAPKDGLGRLVSPAFENGLGSFKDGGGVYRNLQACELTRQLVLDFPQWTIPAMNRFLVESATHPEKVEELNRERGSAWIKYWNDIYGKDIADACAARNVALPVDKPFAEVCFASDEEKICTRLGADGARIKFTTPVRGPFGTSISSVTLPAHWSRGITADEPVTPVRVGGVLQIKIGEAHFSYGREGLEKLNNDRSNI